MCALVVGAVRGASPEISLTAVRHWSLGDVTRIAIETTGEVQFRYDRLHRPERLYFDLSGTKSVLARRGIKAYNVNDRLVKQIRVAQTRRDVTRVVVDLARPAEFTTSQLANPSRLMIEIREAAVAPVPPVAAATDQPAGPPMTAGQGKPAEAVDASPAQPAKVTPRRAARTESGGARPEESHNAQTTRKAPAETPAPAPSAANLRKPRAESVGRAESSTTRPADPQSARTTRKAPVETPAPAQEAQTTRKSSTESEAARSVDPSPARDEPSKSASRVPEHGGEPPASAATPPAVPAKGNALGGRSLTRALGLKLGRIVLDPGHGGHDHGTTGPKGLTEKDLVLDIAKRLGSLIEERMGSQVIYTRTDDSFVPLETRTQIANEAEADLFLSIHANSSRMGSIAGVETFYLDLTTSKADLDVAARENASSDKKIFELTELVKKITMNDKVKESREFAARVQDALHGGLSRGNSRVRNRGVKKAPFIVLIGASMPSVLTEIGFVSNPREEALFSRPEYRQKVAEALLKGLTQYASTLSHFDVASTARE